MVRPLWTEGRVSILRSAEGKPIGFLAIVRDINERRRAQELFKTLANNSLSPSTSCRTASCSSSIRSFNTMLGLAKANCWARMPADSC